MSERFRRAARVCRLPAAVAVGWLLTELCFSLLPATPSAVAPGVAQAIYGGEPGCTYSGYPVVEISLCDACGGPVTGLGNGDHTTGSDHSKRQGLSCPDPLDPRSGCYETYYIECNN